METWDLAKFRENLFEKLLIRAKLQQPFAKHEIFLSKFQGFLPELFATFRSHVSIFHFHITLFKQILEPQSWEIPDDCRKSAHFSENV